MYDIFGKYGAIRQIRIGSNKDTRGTAYVIYEDIYDAKTGGGSLVRQAKMSKRFDQKKREEEIVKMQEKYGITTKDNHIHAMVSLIDQQHLPIFSLPALIV
uniref:RRM domain-containing protein n=1 Tax=Salix viminalis TaxID=40686 RepID=A0A6N2LDD3_SALVM